MPLPQRWLLLFLVAVLSALQASAADSLEELRDKLARERDADDRAKITVEIGEALLSRIGQAFKKGALEEGNKLLEEYLQAVRQAHEDLTESGRDARRKPKGFKHLEIHLRRSHRELQELGHLLTFEERKPVDEAIREVESIREKILDNLMSRGQNSG